MPSPGQAAAEYVKQALYEIMPKPALDRFESKDGADFAYTFVTEAASASTDAAAETNGRVFRAIPSKALSLDPVEDAGAVSDVPCEQRLILVTVNGIASHHVRILMTSTCA